MIQRILIVIDIFLCILLNFKIKMLYDYYDYIEYLYVFNLEIIIFVLPFLIISSIFLILYKYIKNKKINTYQIVENIVYILIYIFIITTKLRYMVILYTNPIEWIWW